jgi:hypothetical protein
MPMHNFAVAIKSLKEKIEKNKGASKW